MARFNYSIGWGGGIGECYGFYDRTTPSSAINCWLEGTRKCPTDCGIEADEPDSWKPDLKAYRAFWVWINANPDKLREMVAKARAKNKRFPYTYGHPDESAIEKAATLVDATETELWKAHDWSGYGPFTRG